MLPQRWSTRVEALLFREPMPGGITGAARRLLQVCWALARDFFEGYLTLRATGLVYVTILSIVPIIGLSFSVLKAFGLQQHLADLLADWLAPLGSGGGRVLDTIMGFVENLQNNVFAGLGAALLLLTIISMAQRVESSFNFVWRVALPRSFARRVTDYVAIVLLGPVVMATAMAVIASIESSSVLQDLAAYRPTGGALWIWNHIGPLLLVSSAFAFVNWFIPNTRVSPVAALAGGLVGGLAWSASGVFFARFVVVSTHTLNIYAGFAIAIIALVWLYLCWLTLLLGAQVAFYLQHPEYLRLGYRAPGIGGRRTEQIALSVMLLAARASRHAGARPTVDSVSRVLGMPAITVDPVLNRLEAAGLLARSRTDELLFERDPAKVLVRDILAAVREPVTASLLPSGEWPPEVTGVLESLDASRNRTLGDLTLDSLLQP